MLRYGAILGVECSSLSTGVAEEGGVRNSYCENIVIAYMSRVGIHEQHFVDRSE